jgi:hypothetical protein
MQSRTDDVRQEVRRQFQTEGSGIGRREVELYVRTYMTLLESSSPIALRSLEPAHLTAGASLHAGAEEPEPDMNAFLYSANRLPAGIVHVSHVILGQTPKSFSDAGFDKMHEWEPVSSPGRRRRWYWNGDEMLAAYIASSSDLDDLIPSLVAYQIEWNKMSRLLRDEREAHERLLATEGDVNDPELERAICNAILMSEADWKRLKDVWKESFWTNLRLVAKDRKRMDVQMFGGTYLGYARSTRSWWRPVVETIGAEALRERPVYFISSNTHSFVNVLSGVANRRRDELMKYIDDSKHPELYPELNWWREGRSRSSLENLLYFAARPYFHGPVMDAEREQRMQEEEEIGIRHVEPNSAVDVGIQVIEMDRLDPSQFDARLSVPYVGGSDAIIVNINYPLGRAAYHIMSQIAISVDYLQGVYILGKAATLNGRIGDIMMSNVVYDEHSGNTYWFDNCFGSDDVAPYLRFGAALDNQKAVTVKGTYLQNQGYLDFFYRENYTVVEMEAGPYLSSLYEDSTLERHPQDEAINLMQMQESFDLGIIHYASDTPYTRAHTLGARGLSFYGMDSTYASTIAILQRIFQMEAKRLGKAD